MTGFERELEDMVFAASAAAVRSLNPGAEVDDPFAIHDAVRLAMALPRQAEADVLGIVTTAHAYLATGTEPHSAVRCGRSLAALYIGEGALRAANLPEYWRLPKLDLVGLAALLARDPSWKDSAGESTAPVWLNEAKLFALGMAGEHPILYAFPSRELFVVATSSLDPAA